MSWIDGGDWDRERGKQLRLLLVESYPPRTTFGG